MGDEDEGRKRRVKKPTQTPTQTEEARKLRRRPRQSDAVFYWKWRRSWDRRERERGEDVLPRVEEEEEEQENLLWTCLNTGKEEYDLDVELRKPPLQMMEIWSVR